MSNNVKKVIKVIGVILACVLLLVCVFIVGFWFYVKNHPEILPITASVNYVGGVVDKDGKEHSFIEVEVWKNEDGLGTAMAEFTLTGYTDWDKSGVISKGIQFVMDDYDNLSVTVENKKTNGWTKLCDKVYTYWGVKDTTSVEKANLNAECKKFYYDKQKDIAWSSVNELDRSEKLIVEIDNEFYAISLDGTSTYETEETTLKGIVGGVGNWLKSFFVKDTRVKFTETKKWSVVKDLDNMVVDMISKLSISNVKNGTYRMSLVDLSDYFKLQRYNKDTKQFENCDKQTFNIDYFQTQVTVHSNGVRKSSESSFGLIKNDNDFFIKTVNDYYADYGAVDVFTVLNCSDFDWTYYNTFTMQDKSTAYIKKTYTDILIPKIKTNVLQMLIDNGIEKVTIDFEDLKPIESYINSYMTMGTHDDLMGYLVLFSDFIGTIGMSEEDITNLYDGMYFNNTIDVLGVIK